VTPITFVIVITTTLKRIWSRIYLKKASFFHSENASKFTKIC